MSLSQVFDNHTSAAKQNKSKQNKTKKNKKKPKTLVLASAMSQIVILNIGPEFLIQCNPNFLQTLFKCGTCSFWKMHFYYHLLTFW